MTINVLTPDKEIFSGPITSVRVPGVNGQFQVLDRHAPIVSALQRGEVAIVKTDGVKLNFEVGSGFIEVLNNQVSLLVQGVTGI